MQLHFVGNILSTNMKVIGSTVPEYLDALIDTGAFKTGIPLPDCQNLEYQGVHPTSGLFGSESLPLFKCRIELETGDTHKLEILGLPLSEPLIGRDILSKYELDIDFPGRTATARRTWLDLPR